MPFDIRPKYEVMGLSESEMEQMDGEDQHRLLGYITDDLVNQRDLLYTAKFYFGSYKA